MCGNRSSKFVYIQFIVPKNYFESTCASLANVIRREADVNMEGHFLVRQIYDDEVTYNIVGAAEKVLSKFYIPFINLII